MSTAPLTQKGSATREKILKQSRKMLIERGYGKLIMREVSDACGMKLGNLQYYFPSHDALVRAIIEAETQQDLAIASRVLQQHEDPEKRLRGVVNELLTRWRGDSGIVFSTLYLLVPHDKSYRTIYSDTYARYYELVEGVIEQLAPDQTKQEYATRARLLCALIDGVAYQTDIGRKADFLSRIEDQAYGIAIGDDANNGHKNSR